MSLSRNQNALYWREWAAAKRVLMPGRETWTKDEETRRRHELHLQAIGEEKSHTEFTNADFDKVLAEFRAVSRPGDLAAQLRQLNQERNRLRFGIRNVAAKLGADDGYVAGIVERMNAEGKLGGSDLDELGPDELRKVMVALRKQAGRTSNAERSTPNVELAEEPF